VSGREARRLGHRAAERASGARAGTKMNLFAYGTLMDGEIFRDVAGEPRSCARGGVSGYVRRFVRGEDYPGMIAAPEGRVDGVVYFGVSAAGWGRLDRFEGELYLRTPVGVRLEDGTATEALAYVIRDDHRAVLTDRDWTYEQFQASGRQRFRERYFGFERIRGA
jgi:gamma-glutamylcyclotransferase (GGCT)/AIG2-like uncharacterized protein YtfP